VVNTIGYYCDTTLVATGRQHWKEMTKVQRTKATGRLALAIISTAIFLGLVGGVVGGLIDRDAGAPVGMMIGGIGGGVVVAMIFAARFADVASEQPPTNSGAEEPIPAQSPHGRPSDSVGAESQERAARDPDALSSAAGCKPQLQASADAVGELQKSTAVLALLDDPSAAVRIQALQRVARFSSHSSFTYDLKGAVVRIVMYDESERARTLAAQCIKADFDAFSPGWESALDLAIKNMASSSSRDRRFDVGILITLGPLALPRLQGLACDPNSCLQATAQKVITFWSNLPPPTEP
jgi:hypothetical protein